MIKHLKRKEKNLSLSVCLILLAETCSTDGGSQPLSSLLLLLLVRKGTEEASCGYLLVR